MMVISSRTPEGSPNLCPVCGSRIRIEPSDPAGDAPCPICGHLLWFTWEVLGDAVVMKPTCAVLRAEDFDAIIVMASGKQGVQIVLDFDDVESISSPVLGKPLSLKRKVAGVGGRLKIDNLHPELVEVFRYTHLDKVFNIGR